MADGPRRRLVIGDQLAEVFSVRLDDHVDGVDAVNLYGKIMFTNDDVFFKLFYNRESKDYESIKPGETLTLIDPTQEITKVTNTANTVDVSLPFDVSPNWLFTFADDNFAIDVDLYSSPEDVEFLRDKVVCVPRRFDILQFNTLLSKTIHGARGSLTVQYAVFKVAVVAKVVVILINAVLPKGEKRRRLFDADGKDSAHVYGSILAHENHLSQEIRLFRVVEPKESVKVIPGEEIVLSRSMVVVPSKSYLTVKARLCEYDPESESVDDLVVADGSENFTPDFSKPSIEQVRQTGRSIKQIRQISGEYGTIEVGVSWSYVPYSYD